MRAGSGACGVGIRTRVSGGFRGTADAGSFLLVVAGMGGGPETARTALYPE